MRAFLAGLTRLTLYGLVSYSCLSVTRWLGQTSFCARFCALRRFAGPITLTTARQFTRKDSPPALFYVHSNHTPPASPETSRKGAFQGQSPTENQLRCDARDSATHTGSVTSMISLTTLLASATVAAAAKKVEEAPAPGIVHHFPPRAPFALRAVRTLGVTHGVELTRG